MASQGSEQEAPGGGLRLRDEVEGQYAENCAAICYREDARGDEEKGDGEIRELAEAEIEFNASDWQELDEIEQR